MSAAGSSYFLKAGITPKVFASGQDPHELIHRFPGSPLHRFKKRNLRKSPASRSPAKAAAQSADMFCPFCGRHGRRYSFQFIDFKYEKLILRLYLKKRGSRVAESPAPVLLIVWLLTA